MGFHSGTFAFGAFVVSLAKVAWLVLVFAKNKESASLNPVAAALTRVSACIAQCVERFLEFVSEHAYVEVALRNMSFCDAAHSALALAVRRPLLFGLVSQVSNFVRCLGIVVVSAATTCIIGALLLWHAPTGVQSINTPIIASFFVAFLTAEVMMHPFSVAARAALHCYCLDHERSAAIGLPAPTYTPIEMRAFIEENAERGDGSEPARRCCCF
eukprot:NODE_1075_length_1250_cov_234.401674.p3 GENE.NODE_1075_length_1250_cov_234.401674~~NODE_1075_length_1250_cov_234.401674.p3  ORF type:complete len:214 (+),score=84.48 NODE_1075_length_1250_cov_234.401674:3-644(+)